MVEAAIVLPLVILTILSMIMISVFLFRYERCLYILHQYYRNFLTLCLLGLSCYGKLYVPASREVPDTCDCQVILCCTARFSLKYLHKEPSEYKKIMPLVLPLFARSPIDLNPYTQSEPAVKTSCRVFPASKPWSTYKHTLIKATDDALYMIGWKFVYLDNII